MKGMNKKKGLLWLGTLILTLTLGFATMSCTAGATPVSSNGKLSVAGTHIVNASGKTFQIKGVSTHGLAWFPQYVSKAAFKSLRDDWGVNTVRLAMYTAEYGGYRSGGDKSALKEKISDGVKAATELGMYVIIDWHILNDNNAFNQAGQNDAIGFFTEMAGKYKDYNNVLYEICNEPTSANGGSWSNVRAYASAVIGAIRQIDNDAIIIVGTPNWSQDVDVAAQSPLDGGNLVYALHFYAGTHKDSYRQKAEKAIKAGLPLLVSEFGISAASGNGSVNTSEGNKWISFLDKYGIGYVAWNLSNKNESSALLKHSTKKTSGWKLSNLSKSGKWLVKKYGGKLAKSAKVSSSKKKSSKKTAAKKKSTKKKSTKKSTKKKSSKKSTSKKKSSKKTSTKKKSTKKKSTKGKSSSKSVKATSKYAKATVQKTGSWSDGQRYFTQYKLTVKNKSKKKISSWKVRVKYKYAVEKSSDWNGKYSYKGDSITIKPVAYNKKISAKKSVTDIGFIVSSTAPDNVVVSAKIIK